MVHVGRTADVPNTLDGNNRSENGLSNVTDRVFGDVIMKKKAEKTYTWEQYLKKFCPDHIDVDSIEDDDEFEREVIRQARRKIEDRRMLGKLKAK